MQHLNALLGVVPAPRMPPPCLPFRVVALGGGTGLPTVLRGLRQTLFPGERPWIPSMDRDWIAAIVTVADDGGSSGRIRRAFGIPAPGDIRNCLVALSESETLADLFQARFKGNGDLGGHSLGNLVLTALVEKERDFGKAVERAAELLKARGRVIPCTPEAVTLAAEFLDGSLVEGEANIARARRGIRRVHLRPEIARPSPRALEAIASAELLVLGPGSLYTSLIPVLLVKGIARAIARSRARTVLVMNLMTEPGETDGYDAADFIAAIRRHAPEVPVDHVLLNDAPIPEEPLRSYALQGAGPVRADAASLRALGCRPVWRDFLGDGPLVRHDTAKLGRALVDLCSGLMDGTRSEACVAERR